MMIGNIRGAIRTLTSTPTVTTAAILSLALGIGANTAIFSLINSLEFRPLPVADPGRLAIVRGETGSWSNPVWEQIRASEQAFAGAFAWGTPRLDLSDGGRSQMVDGLYVSAAFFDVLGVRAAIGRTFTRADDRRDGGPDGPVAVISHDFWRRHFGGSPDAIGKSITIRGVPFTVIGVTAAGFFGPDVGRSFDVAVPLNTQALITGDNLLDQSNSRFLRVIVRLRSDQTLEAATAVLGALQSQIRAATMPAGLSADARQRYLTEPFTLQVASGGESRLTTWVRPLYIVFAIVVCVLLIACSNIANLLLARAASRQQELSLRVALGASPRMLFAMLLSESFVLAATGAALGYLFSHWTSRLLVDQLSSQVNRVHLDLSLDWRVFVFTAGVTGGTALLFGLLPAVRAMRANPRESLYARGAAGAGGSAVTGMLVVAQVALSLSLVVAAGLFGRTFVTLTALPVGFDAHRLLAVNIDAPRTRFEADDLPDLYRRVRESVLAVPGVENAAMSVMVPLSATSNAMVRVDDDRSPSRAAHVNVVTPGWFATLGIPIARGRDFTDGDRTGSPAVALVNESFVRTFMTGRDPIGRRISTSRNDLASVEIVGVTRDAVYRALREPPPPTIYYAFAQQPAWPSVYLTVRTSVAAPDALTAAITAAIVGVNRNLFVQFRSVDDQIRASMTRERLLAIVTAFFGGLGVLLASVGLFGVTSYGVTQRRAEISVRLAIGASPEGIVRLVLARVAQLVLAGVAVGAVLTWWLADFVSATQLYGVEPRDLPTLAAAALLLIGVTVFAGWWPARRAARFDPAPLLRSA